METKKFIAVKREIMQFTQIKDPFICLDIAEAQKQNDKLKAKIQKNKEDFELEKKKLAQEKEELL